MSRPSAMDGKPAARKAGPLVGAVHLLFLAVAALVAGLTSSLDTWHLGQLAVIVVLTVAGDLLSVEIGSRLRVSGTSLGVMLAIVLQGPAAAVVVALIAVALGWLRSREQPPALLHNFVNHAWFALVGGLFFQTATEVARIGADDPAYYLLVFATSVVILVVNFLAAASYRSYLDRVSIIQKVREHLLPLLSAHLVSAIQTMGAVFVAVKTGTVGIALMGLMVAVFQYLVGELLKSKQRGEKLERLATTDTLTGLINRDHFHSQLNKLIAEGGPNGGSFPVMLIDLDRFKEINDTLGHHYGDELLRELGPRLSSAAGPDGLVARLGGDEFAIMPGIEASDPETIEFIASAVIGCIQEAIVVDELALEVGASMGIARFPIDGMDAGTLLRCADVAMYAAKEARTDWKFYASELDRNSVRKLSVLSDFRRALQRDELVVFFQPIVDVAGSRVRGAEALVRWEHPKLGLLGPAAFVETIEQTGLIGPMTRIVLEQSIHQCAQWRAAGQHLSVAVNLSVRNLLDRTLPAEIDRLLTAYHLPPEALQLEITESVLMSDPERVLATVTRLNALGVRLSVDDFGTGYSSLANLRQMPIDELKIDRSFVSPMLQDESDLIIVRSTINLGHDLGLRVIAEGVEDEPTLNRLARLGCDLAQGYHLSRPLPAEQFTRWLDGDARPDVVLAV